MDNSKEKQKRIKDSFNRATRPIYQSAIKEMERRRKNDHLLVIKLMEEAKINRRLQRSDSIIPDSRRIIGSQLEDQVGIAASLLQDPFHPIIK